MCDRFLGNQDHVDKIAADASFVTKKNLLRFTGDHSGYEKAIPAHIPSSIVYPKANSYYAFAEDIHPMTRIATVSGHFKREKFPSQVALSEESITVQSFYSGDEAADRYLKNDPPSFVIFGKPGLGDADVASSITDAWNCVLISPVSLIQQEIDAGTEQGRYMERNLRLGKCVGPEIIMNLIGCRIRMRDIKHRGYVVEDLPLIPNGTSLDYSSYSTHVVGTNHDNPEFCEKSSNEIYETHMDESSLGNLDCKVQIDYEQDIPRQINEMFTVWPKRPLIIIYMVCPKGDIVSQRARRRMETVTGDIIDEDRITTHLPDEEPEGDESDTSLGLYRVTNVPSIESEDRDNRRIYLPRRISDMRSNVEMQCDLYKRLALPVIDKWLLAHNPQHVIRVDGRSSARRILEIIDTRLRVLPLQPSIIPKQMIKRDNAYFLGAFSEVDMSNELVEKPAEEAFEVLRRKDNVSPEFPWRLSAWKFYCPVELAQGRTVKGLPKYSVLFLGGIFFLSSQRAADLFVENPRTFLLSPNPRPTCKIAVFGPKYAGKSELSARLAEVFGGTVINVHEIAKELVRKRVDPKNDSGIKIDKSLSYTSRESRAEESQMQELYEDDLEIPAEILPDHTASIRDTFIDLSIEEKANIIVENIKRIPDEELEDDLRRDGGYVVDGMYMDVEVWRKVVNDANVAFEDVIVLFEDEPYAYLLDKFRNLSQPDDIILYEAEYDTEISHEEHGASREDTEWEFLEYLKRFASDWTSFEEQLSEFKGNVIKCNLASVKDVTEYVMNHFKRRFNVATTSTSVEEEEDEEADVLEEATVTQKKIDLTNGKTEGDGEEYPTYTIDLETAERLLNCGYYFLSSFGRWCPVQTYTNQIPIQMFLQTKDRGQIFPVVHHRYIYFLAGEEALSAFLSDSLKYLVCDSSHLLALPLRIAIIGPPKCGKTTLAKRFAETYGMKRISRGKALRRMLKHYGWTESVCTLENQLRAGQATSTVSVMRALEMFSIGPRAACQGYILDGCPSNRREAEQMILSGIQPMIVIDLKADLRFCLECLYWDNDDAKRLPNFSASFLSRRYADWQAHQANFRDWLKKFSQNVVGLDATKSKWYVWTRADHATRSRFAEIRLYFCEANLDKVHRLRYMCVSPFEFRSRQSRYESYCPICLFRENILKTSGQPTDSQGMVQFREYFYWICPRHMDTFIEDPLQHIPPVNTACLPNKRPEMVRGIVDVEHICWARRLRADGLCLVTYVDGLPDSKLTQGRADLAVLLDNRVYLFCSEECREKFLAEHGKYAEVDIMFPRQLSPIELRRLPDLDYLEQTVARTLVEAVNLVATRRPKIFGLSAAVSAAIHIGVYLKIHDMCEDLNEMDVYKAASERMAGRDRIVKIVTDNMKKKLNPYVSLPKYP